MRALLCTLFLFTFLAFGCSTVSVGNKKAAPPTTGAAAGATSVGENKSLEHCRAPLGTASVYEDEDASWYALLKRHELPSTIPLIRLIVQQSNCFVLVERGRAMRALMRERELMKKGELRRRSHFHKGQLVAADYTIIPQVNFKEKGTSGIGGLLGGMLGSIGVAVGGMFKSNDAVVTLTLIDNRSGVQVAVAQGSARGYDLGGLGGVLGGGFAGLGAYSKTPEGKVIAAAFLDAYNKLVKTLREYKMQTIKGGLGTGGKLKIQK